MARPVSKLKNKLVRPAGAFILPIVRDSTRRASGQDFGAGTCRAVNSTPSIV